MPSSNAILNYLPLKHSIPKTIVFGDSPYTILDTDYILRIDSSGGAITVNLPAATATGRELRFKKLGTNTVTFDASGSETIDNDLTFIVTTELFAFSLHDGSSGNWDIY